jgi:tryptophan synthase alpha chain
MDGVTIQRAGTKALERGVCTRDVFAAVEAVSNTGTPALVMTYWNLVERYGADRFARDLASAGGAGAITPDLTPDEAAEWISVSDDHGLDRVFLISPSSTDERLASTVAACRGWVYATSLMGVTGARAQTSAAAPELVQRVRKVDPAALVGVGLGVSNSAQAREVTTFADLVIVGSALVKTLLDAEDAGRPGDLSGLRRLVADLAAGVRGGGSEHQDRQPRTPSAGPAESGTSQRSPGLVGT